MDPYTLVSADAHAGLPTEQYRTYLEAKYHDAFDEYLGTRDQQLADQDAMGTRNEQFAKQWFEEHEEALAAGWDAIRRDQEMDTEGIAAEVIFPDADAVESRTSPPFGVGLGLSGDTDPELGMAGAKAHNRWLAEMCSHSPERRCGVALIQITAPLDDVLAEIRRAKASGLNAVMIPAMWMTAEPYHHKRYDPIWALCQDLDMPIATHSGPAARDEYDNNLGIYITEVVWWPVRPLWFMLWSGVFHRFPRLKFGVVESTAWWAPNYLWFWDRIFMAQKGAEKISHSQFAGKIEMLPSEYFDRNCFIGASQTKRRELAFRYEIGIDNLLWGSDFPHPEGTWPGNREWLTKTFFDIPIDETRRILGEAAAETFGFDLAALKPIADKIGPTPEELGQLRGSADGSDLVAKWAGHKEVGRHWLTGFDFPLVP